MLTEPTLGLGFCSSYNVCMCLPPPPRKSFAGAVKNVIKAKNMFEELSNPCRFQHGFLCLVHPPVPAGSVVPWGSQRGTSWLAQTLLSAQLSLIEGNFISMCSVMLANVDKADGLG